VVVLHKLMVYRILGEPKIYILFLVLGVTSYPHYDGLCKMLLTFISLSLCSKMKAWMEECRGKISPNWHIITTMGGMNKNGVANTCTCTFQNMVLYKCTRDI
jgi:hypothetical protein